MGGDEFEVAVGDGNNEAGKSSQEEEDLLAATQSQVKRARPQFVNYAKKSKRVDVKKLKENIWKGLTLEIFDHPDGEVEKLEAKEFTSVISGLRAAYPEEKMEEISTSFCFICLLHLANENGLRIESAGSTEGVTAEASTKTNDMETTNQLVGGLDRLKIKREVMA